MLHSAGKPLYALSLLSVTLLVGCGGEDRDASVAKPPVVGAAYQQTRPIDQSGWHDIDPHAPALAVASASGRALPPIDPAVAAQIGQINAMAVSQGGACYRKPKELARSNRAEWGMTSGREEQLSVAQVTLSKNFIAKRAQYDSLVRISASQHSVDPVLVHAIITQESGYDPTARSAVGAVGLMQLMPETGKEVGVLPYERTHPGKNIHGGSLYFKRLIKQMNGNVALAIASYNAGAGNVQWCGYRIPPFKETRHYVQMVMGYATVYKREQSARSGQPNPSSTARQSL